ncbi:cytochrome P450 2J3-like [Acanthaster planci]|uniref:Cytochrome P450 2J3-like n=1 Tax=Acanthaster planci TaxID=133434 RepID=A0A8B7YB82_ACAPL|nr:cytochrome P450 2J3-like [Acanthaster planci]
MVSAVLRDYLPSFFLRCAPTDAGRGSTAMIDPWTVILLGLCAVLGVLRWHLAGRNPVAARNLPRMPFTSSLADAFEDIRITAHLFQQGLGQPHHMLNRFSKKYGPVFSVTLPYVRIVILSSYDAIREAFQNQFLNDRPVIQVLKHGVKGHGVAFSSGETWKVQRKMVLNFLRAFGVNRTSFEEKIALEASHLNAELQQLGGRPFDPSHLFANAVSNIICSVVFGQRYEYSDPRFKKLLRAVYRNVAIIGGSTGPLQMLPFAYLLKPFLSVLKETEDNGKLINSFARDVLEDHQKDFDPKNPRDFTDVFLRKMAAEGAGDDNGTDNNNEDDESILSVHNMCATASDLFMAGTETTSTSLRWGLLYMLAYPDVLAKVQRELDSVVGRDRLPTMSDKPRLPYTEATLMELQRIANILPLGIPHQASQDTTLQGYDIPKGSVIMPNMWGLSTDSELWDEPEAFRPERFLDETEQNVIKHEAHIPFSIGRRMCIGEQLAKMELFIFLTHLFHQFTIKKPEDSPPVSFKGIMGVTLSPLPYKVCVVPRS